MSKSKMNCQDQSDQVWSMMKTRHDNDVIDCTGTINAENEIELS